MTVECPVCKREYNPNGKMTAICELRCPHCQAVVRVAQVPVILPEKKSK